MKNNHMKNKYHEIWVEDGIIHGVYNPDLKIINIDIARQLVNDRLKISQEVVRPVLADTSNVKSVTREAEKYMASDEAMKYLSATAILVHSIVAKLIANIYIRLSRPSIPTQVFVDKKKALNWLKQFK